MQFSCPKGRKGKETLHPKGQQIAICGIGLHIYRDWRAMPETACIGGRLQHRAVPLLWHYLDIRATGRIPFWFPWRSHSSATAGAQVYISTRCTHAKEPRCTGSILGHTVYSVCAVCNWHDRPERGCLVVVRWCWLFSNPLTLYTQKEVATGSGVDSSLLLVVCPICLPTA